MNKLITGGGGLVGSEFKDGYKVSTKDYNLLSEKLVNEMFMMYAPDVVIHTAAKVNHLNDDMNHQAEYFRVNMVINNNVIHYAHKYGVKKLICVFHNVSNDQYNSGYAHAQNIAETQLRLYNYDYGTQYFAVLPTNIYGKNDKFDINSIHIIPALIAKCYMAMVNNTDFVVSGSGDILREFIYAEDVAKICDILIEKYQGTEPLIISSSVETRIGDVATMIAEIMNFKGNIIFDNTKPDGEYRKPTDNINLHNVVGDFIFTSLRHGLEKTIEHFLEKQK